MRSSASPAARQSHNGPVARALGLGQSEDMDRFDAPSSEQLEIYRRMTQEQRWQAGRRLYWTLRRHKAAFLRQQHPEWTEAAVAAAVRRSFLHARS